MVSGVSGGEEGDCQEAEGGNSSHQGGKITADSIETLLVMLVAI